MLFLSNFVSILPQLILFHYDNHQYVGLLFIISHCIVIYFLCLWIINWIVHLRIGGSMIEDRVRFGVRLCKSSALCRWIIGLSENFVIFLLRICDLVDFHGRHQTWQSWKDYLPWFPHFQQPWHSIFCQAAAPNQSWTRK